MTDEEIEQEKLDRAHSDAAADKCNCMISYGVGGVGMMAIREGDKFLTPDRLQLKPPDHFEDMDPVEIKRHMRKTRDFYIGRFV